MAKPKKVEPITKAAAAAAFAEHNVTETTLAPHCGEEGRVKAAPHADPDLQCQCAHCQTHRGELEAAPSAS